MTLLQRLLPALILAWVPWAAQAQNAPQIWLVGPDQPLHQPSDAARVAHDGDTVRIEPGEYFDCAGWSQNRLTIEGTGPGVVITDKTCQGKALFVTRGQSTHIRNITFTRARVPDGNGAGIRAEGRDLTVENSRFVNNEVAILAADAPGAEIKVTGSYFEDNGRCRGNRCLATIIANQLAVLTVARSEFVGDMGSDVIASRALKTELTDNRIVTAANAPLTHVVIAQGAVGILMERCTIDLARLSGSHQAVVFLGLSPFSAGQMRVADNQLVNRSPDSLLFVLNWTGGDIAFERNSLSGKFSDESSSGRWSHWVYYGLLDLRDTARHLVGSILRAAHLVK